MTAGGFSAHELFAIAREMEAEGVAFYKAVAKQVHDPEAKALFLKLASDELGHVRDLERLEKRAEDYFPSENDSLVAQYLHGVVETNVFPPLADVPVIAAASQGVLQAIDIGIGAEKRAMDFYTKTRDKASRAEATETLDRLRAEEEEHLRKLTVLRRRVADEH